MSDYGEIASLVSRVAWMVDHEDYDTFMDYWVEDAMLRHVTVDGVVTERRGREIVELLQAAYATPETRCLHIPCNPVIDLDGDEALARYYVLHTKMGPQARPVGVEECETRLRRGEDGRWRIRSRNEVQLLAYDRVG